MFLGTRNRKAVSTVITTMIILVASVVLGTGVVSYGTSLFQTNASSEAISTTGTHLWVDSTGNSGWAWGAFDVRNSGDKLLSVDKIQIRGQAVPYANWYADANATQVTNQFQSVLVYSSMVVAQNSPDGQLNNGTFAGYPLIGNSCPNTNGNLIMQLTTGSPSLCFNQQSGPVSLVPGAKAIIYFKVPQNLLTSVDAGSANSIGVYAGKVGSPISVTVVAK